jgi:hypothetical protein
LRSDIQAAVTAVEDAYAKLGDIVNIKPGHKGN